MKSWKLVALLFVTAMLTSCISVVPPANKDQKFRYLSWKERQARISKVKYFVASGAFSISERGQKPVFANYRWIQNNKGFYRIRVSSALNLFNVTILGRLHSVTLWKNPRKHITARTPEALIKREMGWTLPVRNLYYWIRGVAAPGAEKISHDKYGHLTSLKQDGWYIRFSYYKTVKGYDLPEKVVLQRPHVAITIVVKDWILTRKDVPII